MTHSHCMLNARSLLQGSAGLFHNCAEWLMATNIAIRNPVELLLRAAGGTFGA